MEKEYQVLEENIFNGKFVLEYEYKFTDGIKSETQCLCNSVGEKKKAQYEYSKKQDNRHCCFILNAGDYVMNAVTNIAESIDIKIKQITGIQHTESGITVFYCEIANEDTPTCLFDMIDEARIGRGVLEGCRKIWYLPSNKNKGQ